MNESIFLKYQEQLETPMWNSCRDRILERDKNQCCFCGKGQSTIVCFDNSVFHFIAVR